MKKSEIRKHYFLDRYVIFSPKRNLRPQSISEEEKKKKEEAKESCFFCPGKIKGKLIYKVGQGKKWDIAVIPNKFPALTLDNKKAFGKQEIVIETPEHRKELSDLSTAQIGKVLQVYDQRIQELSKIRRIKYVLVFKNDGGKAGASIPHAHSQIYALPIIPPEIKSISDTIDDYQLNFGRCPFCDVIKKERKEKVRIAYENEHFIAISPYASSSAYGLWIMPKKHIRRIQDLNKRELSSLAQTLKHTLKKLDDIDLPYNFFIHNSLDTESHHFRLKIVPRLTIWSGLELGSGIIINPVFPEDAARFYRS